MKKEAGYNFLDTTYTGTSASYLSGIGNDIYNIYKIITVNDTGVAKTTREGETI